MWISAMPDADLNAAWTVLTTEATATASGIKAIGSGVTLVAGDVLVGVDESAHRHLLIPLHDGEAFAEDRRGPISPVWSRIDHSHASYLSAVCLDRDLDAVFAQFASELLTEVAGATSPVKATISALERWRRLFSDAGNDSLLTEPKIIGLLAELHVLEQIVAADGERRLDCLDRDGGKPARLSTWTCTRSR